MRVTLVLSLFALAATGCALAVPENYFGCTMDSECPPGWFCNGDRCASQRATVDASVDGGAHLDAAHDASTDAARSPDAPGATDAAGDVGADAGDDASSDGGPTDLLDAGTDAAVVVDAGHDAGHDASTWTPNGVYASSGVTYSCAEFDFNVTSWTFTDDGTTLHIDDPTHDVACQLSGPTARATGAFDASCVVVSTGGCTASYRFMGAFTGDDAWTATFYASFAGSGNACGTSPDTCHTQMFTSVPGSR